MRITHRLMFFGVLSLCLGMMSASGYSQAVTVRCQVMDAASKQPLHAATVRANENVLATDTNGVGTFRKQKGELVHFVISYTGYSQQQMDVAATDTLLIIEMIAEAEDDGAVIVTATRNNSRIEDLAARVEVLGRDEMDEENGIKPGNIAGILGDFAGIQIQQTNAATSNADMRIQGLPGKYTQMLRDGLPLYGGFGSSFNILQIPPLDLQQIELIKGSASTLYGGGAIAGMVNIVSKKPKLNHAEHLVTINTTTLKETNVNLFTSGRNEKVGYTLFAGGNAQKAVDVNKDGFSDVPDVGSVNVHPRMFVYLKDGSSLVFGYNMIYEDRKGGDMQVLENAKDTQHQFFIQNQSLRNTADGVWDRKLSATSNIMTKVSVSFYDRDITTNIFGMKALQTAAYGELSYNQHWNRHNLVAGFNYTGDYLRIHQPDSSNLTDQQYYTFGAFIQDDWTISKHFLIQAGFRGDGYHYSYGKKPYLLPRISVKYSADKHLTVRAGGGLGYKTPNVFSSEVDERDYRLLLNPGEDVKAETSAGVNADINYKTKWRLWELNVNQAFYYTSISHTLLYDSSNGFLRLYNEISTTTTQGAETYIMAKRKNWEYYLGYTYTNAHRNYNNAYPHLPLTAKHKFAALISTEIGSHFRTGIESSFVGNQYLNDGRKTASYMMMALMVRYNIGRFAFVLNGENLLDYRQSKQETVVYPPYENPKFPEIWAPLDGRVINFSVQVKW